MLSFLLKKILFRNPRHPRTSQNHGKGQAENCGQFSHRGTMARNVGNGESGWMSTQDTFDATNPDAPLPFARRTTYPFVPNLKLLSSLNWSIAPTSASATGSRTSFGVLVWLFIHLLNASSAMSSPILLRSALSLRTWPLVRVDWSMVIIFSLVNGVRHYVRCWGYKVEWPRWVGGCGIVSGGRNKTLSKHF